MFFEKCSFFFKKPKFEDLKVSSIRKEASLKTNTFIQCIRCISLATNFITETAVDFRMFNIILRRKNVDVIV